MDSANKSILSRMSHVFPAFSSCLMLHSETASPCTKRTLNPPNPSPKVQKVSDGLGPGDSFVTPPLSHACFGASKHEMRLKADEILRPTQKQTNRASSEPYSKGPGSC